jgi:hypothetical protein
VNTRPTNVLLGPHDPFHLVPTLSLQDGKITFVPGNGAHDLATTQAEFPSGSRLEYRIEKSDMYFEGDHSQSIDRSLWVKHADGSRRLLARGFTLYIHLDKAAKNLQSVGIPFRVLSFYKDRNGQEIESEIQISHSRLKLPLVVVLSTSSFWLGIPAAIFLHELRYLIAVGLLGFCILAIVTVTAAASKRTALLHILTTIPTYTAGYAVSVIMVRHSFR